MKEITACFWSHSYSIKLYVSDCRGMLFHSETM